MEREQKKPFLVTSLKKFIIIFVLFFGISFIVFDWPEIRELLGLGGDDQATLPSRSEEEKNILREALQLPFPEVENKALEEGLSLDERSPGELSPAASLLEGNRIEIAKLGISAPLVSAKGSTEAAFQQALKKGVVLFPSSSLPGQGGETIILGHSAPRGYPRINYDWVFSRLNELEQGDLVFISFNHQAYLYQVVSKAFLDKGEELPSTEGSGYGERLVLLTCWPPGRDQRRIAVEAIGGPIER